MKRAFVLLGAVTLLTGNAFAQADVIIKKRAQEIRDQNNVRQGVTPPSQSAHPATTPAASASPHRSNKASPGYVRTLPP